MELRKLIIDDLIKIENYQNYEEEPLPFDSPKFNEYSDEILNILHTESIKMLIGFQNSGYYYPSILESLNIKNDQVLSVIRQKKKQERSDEIKRTINNYHFKYSNSEDEFCGACHQSPCMCSDREATSTIHDF